MLGLGLSITENKQRSVADWARQMIASYRTLHPEQAVWFDTTEVADIVERDALTPVAGQWAYVADAGAGSSKEYVWDSNRSLWIDALLDNRAEPSGKTALDELIVRLADGGYLQTTFGDKKVCDFVFLLLARQDMTTRTINKTGDLLRWDIDGTVTVQNNPPAHTLGSGAGIVTCSTTDGWSGITVFSISGGAFAGALPLWDLPSTTGFYIYSNPFSGLAPNWSFPALQTIYAYATKLSGTAPNWNFPNVVNFNLAGNQFSGEAPLWDFPVVDLFEINNNQFSGEAPLWDFPEATRFKVQSNQFSGVAPNWNLPKVTSFYISHNQFSGEALLWDLPVVINFNIENNQFSGNAPLWNLPKVTNFQIHTNQFSGVAPNWNLPEVTSFYIHTNQFSGAVPAWNMPKISYLVIHTNEFTSVDAPLVNLPTVRSFLAQGNGLSQAAVDAAFSAIHSARATYTYATPRLDIHGSNAAPSGIYQANCPTPATGKEQWYHLVNDPCVEGFKKWSVTANT